MAESCGEKVVIMCSGIGATEEQMKEQMTCNDHRREKQELVEELMDPKNDSKPIPVLTQETLLIWGDEDNVFPLFLAYQLQRHLGPKSRLEIVKDAMHAANIDSPHAANTCFRAGNRRVHQFQMLVDEKLQACKVLAFKERSRHVGRITITTLFFFDDLRSNESKKSANLERLAFYSTKSRTQFLVTKARAPVSVVFQEQ
ncbi:hypothetical protein POM88_013443 [Heracleum sosnowskyi]|uniref:Uncharacterized protein n=1 Tax=Heracleum sosnowskyi TaxID=360622 RepID=A0AAD8IYG7_9APIA|nr:hypothetical protein POM88_013443 [Heracleum sosnowskyi]